MMMGFVSRVVSRVMLVDLKFMSMINLWQGVYKGYYLLSFMKIINWL